MMREIENIQLLNSRNQYVGTSLETLPEAESEEENSDASGNFMSFNIGSNGGSSDNGSSLLRGGSNFDGCSLKCDGKSYCNDESQRIYLLESTICQLEEELRECKDQNELLEFRILEMEESTTTSLDSRSEENGKTDLLDNCSRLDNYTKEPPAESLIDYENCHSRIEETLSQYSNVSENSETLSLQESGIFESSSNDESPLLTVHCSSEKSDETRRELNSLTSQIENLLIRFCDQQKSQVRPKKGTDFGADIRMCHQRILDFETQFTQLIDSSHMKALEDKIAWLEDENARLGETRYELQNAINVKHGCLRVEDRLRFLQSQVEKERRAIETSRIRMEQCEEKEKNVSCQLIKAELLAQRYEEQNFELEESLIELKYSLQFMANFLPLFVLYNLWGALRFLARSSRKSISRGDNEKGGNSPPPLRPKPVIPTKTRSEKAPHLPSGREPTNCRPAPPPRPARPVLLKGGKKEFSPHPAQLHQDGLSLNRFPLKMKGLSLEPSWVSEEKVAELKEQWRFLAASLIVNKDLNNNVLQPDETSDLLGTKWGRSDGTIRPRRVEDMNEGNQFQSALDRFLAHFKEREGFLLKEIDRLQEAIPLGHGHHETDTSQIVFLTEENNRLELDNEAVSARLEEMKLENQNLFSQLEQNSNFRKRLADALEEEKVLRARVEDLELSEERWRDVASELGKRDHTSSVRLHQMREELEFLMSKSVEQEEEMDRMALEDGRLKNENHQLKSKLRSALDELEEREGAVVTNENALHDQAMRLKAQLAEIKKEFTDVECSNGMLREEVACLERTLGETIERLSSGENLIALLSGELKDREVALEELRRELGKNIIPLDTSPNDLEAFEKNDGGLFGLARDVKKVLELIQTCDRCEEAREKLQPTYDQLNALTIMFGFTNNLILNYSYQDQNLEEDKMADEKKSGKIVHLGNEVREREGVIESLSKALAFLGVEIGHLRPSIVDLDERRREMGCGCEEKNALIQTLARRIAHFSSSDSHGFFLKGILQDIEEVKGCPPIHVDFHPDSLATFILSEHRRVVDLLGKTGEETSVDGPPMDPPELHFRVVRRIGPNGILVSWTGPGKDFSGHFHPLEISANENLILRIENPGTRRALLLGLNLHHPLRLTFAWTGREPGSKTMTYLP